MVTTEIFHFDNINRLIIKNARKIRLVSASGLRYARIWGVICPHLGRGSLTGIGDGSANCFFGSTRLWEKQKRAGMFGAWKGGDALELGKGLRPRWVECSKSRKISARF